eukprot:SAG31_NODE_138_length_22877_cov_29.540917_16_plen_166_part_00
MPLGRRPTDKRDSIVSKHDNTGKTSAAREPGSAHHVHGRIRFGPLNHFGVVRFRQTLRKDNELWIRLFDKTVRRRPRYLQCEGGHPFRVVKIIELVSKRRNTLEAVDGRRLPAGHSHTEREGERPMKSDLRIPFLVVHPTTSSFCACLDGVGFGVLLQVSCACAA